MSHLSRVASLLTNVGTRRQRETERFRRAAGLVGLVVPEELPLHLATIRALAHNDTSLHKAKLVPEWSTEGIPRRWAPEELALGHSTCLRPPSSES